MSLVVMLALNTLVLFMEFFEMLSMSPLWNKRAFWLGNTCSYLTAVKYVVQLD